MSTHPEQRQTVSNDVQPHPTKLTIGFSPCPNDTFIFDALVHERIDLEGLTFEPLLADVEELNQRAARGELDVTKLSYHAFGYLIGKYRLLRAGSALGSNVGPLLVARHPLDAAEIRNAHIAIPGKMTTANFLLSLAYPGAQRKTEVLFSDILDGVQNGTYDAGLIIHEDRFTYQRRGLVQLRDLGEFWEQEFHLPIPLGGIAVRADLPAATQQKIQRSVARSVEHAFAFPADSNRYVIEHAQAMDPEVMKQHIDLYVNDYTRDLGTAGVAAVEGMYRVARERGILPNLEGEIFLRT